MITAVIDYFLLLLAFCAATKIKHKSKILESFFFFHFYFWFSSVKLAETNVEKCGNGKKPVYSKAFELYSLRNAFQEITLIQSMGSLQNCMETLEQMK